MIDTQQISRDVLTEKYCKNGETTVDDVYRRVAKGVAKAEVPEKQQEWEDTFYKNMQEGAIGAGRIMSAAGSDIQATLINCFSGETKALTSEGYKDLKDLVGKTTKVFSIDGWRDATFKNFGKQKLYKITFAGNRIHYATLNHRWLSTGEIPMITKAEDLKETTTKDLVGHYIPAVGHIPELNVDISTNYLKRLGFIKVLSVEDTDREEDVYCAVEPVTQTFTIEGNIITRNCFVEPVGDSIKDLDADSNPGIYTALLESAETLKRGGGVGYNFSHIRPKNAFVKSVGSFSSGPCSYINIFDTSCATIESAGGRRGALMGILDINHPDILEFVKAKRTPGRWNNFNVSVMVTDEFMVAKNENKPFQLIHKAKPTSMLIDKGAFQREDGMWVYETIDANVLWDTIMQSNYDYAEPGILFRDTINNDNNLKYVERIDATNPCVTIDTWVMTTDGPKQVRDLIDKPYKAVVDGVSYVSKTGFFFTGKKQIFKVKTTDGYTLKLTDNHLLFKLAGKFEGKNVFAETAVSDLKPIDLLRLNDHKKSLNWDGYGCVNDGFLLGSFLLGMDIGLKSNTNKVRAILEDLHIDPNSSDTPNQIEKTSRQFHIGFLNAVFDSYSTVSITNNELTIKLKYKDYGVLETVQRMLLRLGIVCTRKNTDITISNSNIIRFYTEVGFTDESKDAVINNFIKQNKDTIKKETFVSAIESILPQATEELVYDTTVEDIHIFDANGFHAHNCSEQPLPPYGCCDLGPINLTKFVKIPFTQEAHFDYEKFKLAVSIQVRLLDNVLDVTLWPLEQQRKEAMNKRRIGVGYTGLGNVLAMLGLHYDSEAGRLTAKTIAKTMRDSAYKASVELAKERGPFPLFNKDKYLTDTFASRLPDYIKDEIKKYGIRNSHLLSIAPTGTVSLAFCDNASNGIEPPYSLAYIRKKRENDGTMKPYPVIDYGFRVWLETQESKEAEQILDAVCNYRDHILVGEDKKKVLIKELLPEALVTALELSVDGHLQMLKVTQPYICTAISKTVNIPVDYPFEDFKTIYDKAWEYKLKGVATYRPNDILGSVLSVPMETKKEEVKLVTGNIKEDKMEEAIDRADPKDLDPFTVAYPRRPLGDFPSITRKIVYTGATGDVSLFLTVSFITTFGHKGNDTLIVDRPLEIFIVVPPDDVPVEWVTAYAKNLSLIARSSLPLLVKALQDGRSIKSDKGQIRYGWFDKEDGTRVPRFHSSEVGVIAYAIQELLHSKEILDEEGNLLPINDRNIVKVINTGLPKDSTEEQIVPTEPKQSNGNSVIRTNKVCKHCGASAVIKRDGCSFCTNCNTPGDCG